MTQTLVEELTSTPEGMRLFQQERVILEATELLCQLMETRELSRADLARKLGKTKGYITQVLDGRTNMTLRTVSDLFLALDASVYLLAEPISARNAEPDFWVRSPQFSSQAAVWTGKVKTARSMSHEPSVFLTRVGESLGDVPSEVSWFSRRTEDDPSRPREPRVELAA